MRGVMISAKAIFWDNDGILVDTERLYFQATREVLATIDIELTRELYIEHFLTKDTGVSALAISKGISDGDIEELRRVRNERYTQLLRTEPLVIDGVRDVLVALHGSHSMGIVTSSRQDHFDVIHERSGLLPYFQFVLTSADFSKSKPDPEPYLLALERSGFHKDECLVIEDSERGLAAAKAAGLRCIVVPSDLTRGGRFDGAHAVLGNIRELADELS
jgi:HAD superfamily hydrolase (TIGR01509 family)